MPHPFSVTATNQVTGEQETQSGEFPDAEWADLRQYHACALRLAECRIVDTRSALSLHFASAKGKPVEWRATLPPDDDIAAFLLRLRPFVLESERTYFHRIRGVLGKYIRLPAVRRHLKELALVYGGRSIPFQIEVGSQAGVMHLLSDEAVHTWLNAFEYHHDADKQRVLEAFYEVVPEQPSRALFLYQLLERANAIGKLGAMIDGLTKREGRQVYTAGRAT